MGRDVVYLNTMKFTNPKNGDTLESGLTYPEVIQALKGMAGNKFAQDLAFGNWSQSQEYWAHKLANDARKPAVESTGKFTSLFPLFNTAKTNGLKRAKLRFIQAGKELALSFAPDTGNNPGHLYFKIDGEYAGKVTPHGVFFPSRNCPSEAMVFLTNFAENPVGAAQAYGKETGECCFCAKELTDERSVSVGYGPICAAKWGLPWGE